VGKKNIFPAIEIIVCGGREIFYEGINCDKEVMMLKLRRIHWQDSGITMKGKPSMFLIATVVGAEAPRTAPSDSTQQQLSGGGYPSQEEHGNTSHLPPFPSTLGESAISVLV
jgi:hypothetical protein